MFFSAVQEREAADAAERAAAESGTPLPDPPTKEELDLACQQKFGTHQLLRIDELMHQLHSLGNAIEPEIRADPNHKVSIGMVGYPNVGKSTTINVLCRAKRVAESATPGKTKHFQTIHINEDVVLCDCPGLVFPSFLTTKPDMICNGIMSIGMSALHAHHCTDCQRY
jgi:large subunit GTPase 1